MLSIGIVGLPNVGKSTLFKALTKKQVDISNYPFTTIDPNVGVVAVPDNRLDPLAKMAGSKKAVPAAIEFIDIAGLVKGAARGEGLGNKFLAHIREVNAIAEVVRVFENENIAHIHKTIDPANDIETINAELILADLETVVKHIEKAKKGPEWKAEEPCLEKLKAGLDTGNLAKDIKLDNKEREIAKKLNLLTDKPFIFVLNASESQLKTGYRPEENVLSIAGKNKYVILSGTFELLLSESNEEEQKVYLGELNLGGLPAGEVGSQLDVLIKTAYQALGLITFFSANENEARAWTTKIGTTTPLAAGVIHTDFEKLFIRAEVINWRDLLDVGGWPQARQAGKLRTVGKEYIVQEGDVIDIKI